MNQEISEKMLKSRLFAVVQEQRVEEASKIERGCGGGGVGCADLELCVAAV